MLATALRRLDEVGTSDDRVYAIEGASQAREFRIMSAESAWQETMRARTAHLYEVLTGPCNLYLDIEWYEKSAPASEKKRVQDVVHHVTQCIHATYGEQNPVVTMASASGIAKGKYKCSWHVHISCAKVCWVNTVAVGQFVRKACAALAEVDKVPYAGKGQNWRCVGSSKRADPSRVFLPADHDTFLGCTVQQPVAGRTLVYPDVPVPDSIEIAVPPHIAALAATLNAGGTPVMCGPDRCIVPFRELQWCEHVGRKHHSNHQYAVINTSTLLWKMNCHSCTEAISMWRVFPCMKAVRKAFEAHAHSYAPTAQLPAALCTTGTPARVDMRSHGPPPATGDKGVVLCADGMYCWH